MSETAGNARSRSKQGGKVVPGKVRYALTSDIDVTWVVNYDNIPADAGFLASVKEHGILSPLLVVWRRKEGKYGLVAGFTRFDAAQRLKLKRVPVRVLDLTREDSLTVNLIENIDRNEKSPVKTAKRLAALKKNGVSVKTLAHRLKRHYRSINQQLRAVAKLSPELLDLLEIADVGAYTLREAGQLSPDAQEVVAADVRETLSESGSGSGAGKAGTSSAAQTATESVRRERGKGGPKLKLRSSEEVADRLKHQEQAEKRSRGELSDYERGALDLLRWMTFGDPDALAAQEALDQRAVLRLLEKDVKDLNRDLKKSLREADLAGKEVGVGGSDAPKKAQDALLAAQQKFDLRKKEHVAASADAKTLGNKASLAKADTARDRASSAMTELKKCRAATQMTDKQLSKAVAVAQKPMLQDARKLRRRLDKAQEKLDAASGTVPDVPVEEVVAEPAPRSKKAAAKKPTKKAVVKSGKKSVKKAAKKRARRVG